MSILSDFRGALFGKTCQKPQSFFGLCRRHEHVVMKKGGDDVGRDPGTGKGG